MPIVDTEGICLYGQEDHSNYIGKEGRYDNWSGCRVCFVDGTWRYARPIQFARRSAGVGTAYGAAMAVQVVELF